MLEQNYYTLVSAEEKTIVEDFWIPSEDTRQKVKKGYLVKLIFSSQGESKRSPTERIWVEVRSRYRGRYKGVIKGSPVILKDLIPGEPVEFSYEHICEISPPDKKE